MHTIESFPLAHEVILWDIVLLTYSLVPTLILKPYVMVIMHDPHAYYSFFPKRNEIEYFLADTDSGDYRDSSQARGECVCVCLLS